MVVSDLKKKQQKNGHYLVKDLVTPLFAINWHCYSKLQCVTHFHWSLFSVGLMCTANLLHWQTHAILSEWILLPWTSLQSKCWFRLSIKRGMEEKLHYLQSTSNSAV